MPRLSTTGRPRKTCSNKCRSQSRRDRQRQAEPAIARCETELFGQACQRAAVYVVSVDGTEQRVCQGCREPALALLVSQGAAATAIEVRRHGEAVAQQAPGDPVRGRVLLIEDDERVAGALAPALRRRGLDVAWAGTGSAGLREAMVRSLDVIVLDLGLPDVDGISLLRRLRDVSEVPVIIATARGETVDRVLGFDNGAHDYLVKPYHLDELVARIRNIIRQRAKPSAQIYDDGVLRLAFAARDVLVAGNVVDLSEREFQLLAVLVRSAGAPVTVATIAAQVWGEIGPEAARKRTITVFIATLRGKLAAHGIGPDAIVTARGIGYYYQPPRPATAGPRIGYSHADRLLNSADPHRGSP